MGLISSRISASPLRAAESSALRARQASLPTSQSNDSVWMARRLGTSRCSVILPKETRRGAYALVVRVFAGREAAKMRPSEDLSATAVSRAPQTTPQKPPKQDPKTGSIRQFRRARCWKAAQTSSVAERPTAVQARPWPAPTAPWRRRLRAQHQLSFGRLPRDAEAARDQRARIPLGRQGLARGQHARKPESPNQTTVGRAAKADCNHDSYPDGARTRRQIAVTFVTFHLPAIGVMVSTTRFWSTFWPVIVVFCLYWST